MARALAAYGLQLEAPPAAGDGVFFLLPSNVPTLRAWFAVQTQWRHAGMGAQRTGLDYAGVEALLRQRAGSDRSRRRMFSDLQIMERATLDVWAEQRADSR